MLNFKGNEMDYLSFISGFNKILTIFAIWFLLVVVIRVFYLKIDIQTSDNRVRYTALAIVFILNHFFTL